MGSVFSRKLEAKDEIASVVERIRNIDQVIIDLHQQQYKVSNFFLVAILVGVFAVGVNVVMKQPGLRIEFILFGGLISIVILYIICRIFLNKVYNYRIDRQAKQKDILSQRRSDILKEIKEKVPFKEAREIILKYGSEEDLTSDEVIEKSSPKANKTLHAVTPLPTKPGAVAATPMMAKPLPGNVPSSAQIARIPDAQTPANIPLFKTPGPVRPFPGAARTPIDKIIDYVVGDGPNNRYALICKQCHTHNGMALPEEFLTLSYICFNCNFMNPSKRSVKPMFPQTLPSISSPSDTISNDSQTPIRTASIIQKPKRPTVSQDEQENAPPADKKNTNEES